MLLAAREPPARWPVRLPDLASRLRAMTAAQILPADDDLLRDLLSRLLSDRQLPVPEPVQHYLLSRLPRTAAALREAAARLDRAMLAAGGRVRKSIATQVLSEMAGAAPDCEDFTGGPGPPSSSTPSLL